MSTQHTDVDTFMARAKSWRGEMQKLRSMLLGCGLDEDLKWGKPCYQFEGKNIAILQPFKGLCGLMFFKGALLSDPRGHLRSQGENTQSALRLEFTNERQIVAAVIKDFVKQAIAVEKAGLKADFIAKHELVLPEELERAFRTDRALAKGFQALTPGRQRAYVMHIAGAKQSKTRTARVAACIPRIRAGKGMND
jgi:uncharacterized protein YdeI (YjbR/CyaY-like superfamily)